MGALQAVLRDTSRAAEEEEEEEMRERAARAATGVEGARGGKEAEDDDAAVARRFRARELRLVQNVAALAPAGMFCARPGATAVTGGEGGEGEGGEASASWRPRCEEVAVPEALLLLVGDCS